MILSPQNPTEDGQVASQIEPALVSGSEVRLPRKIVLVVDDNLLNRGLLSKTLAGRYTTVEAEDGLEAIGILERQPIDVIVSDILMPNMDGYALCREVRRRPELKELYFILYTATNFSLDDKKLGLECGADGFVNKQGTPKVILKMIDDHMVERRERAAEYRGPQQTSTPEMEMKKYNARIIRQLEENNLHVEQARDDLLTLNDALEKRGGERSAQLAIANKRLEALNEELEQRVTSRTDELAAKNSILESRTRELESRTEELARSNADLEQFASAASHDLQEPLRAVAGCIQVFDRKYRGKIDDQSDQLIQMIVSGSARMKALIDGILAYSRAGRDEHLEMIDAGEVLQQLLADLNVAIAESQTEVVFAGLPTLLFVKTQFEQVFRNLISNAIKYRSGPGQKVYVRAERQIDGWIFTITDSGIGFEQQYAKQVFGIFQRLHTRDQYLGTGIGLAVSKKIIECRGGKIWVESAIGQGSTFFFFVPDAH
jgi:signal transduction histidine kinase